MKQWDLSDLKAELKFILNANTGITDQAVTATSEDIDLHYRNALNEAYADEIEEAMQVADIRYFITTSTITWPASQTTLDMSPLSEYAIFKIEDITEQDPGELMWFSQWTENSAWFWKDKDTVQWGNSSPASDRTIRVTHVGEPREMVSQTDKPTMMPRRFRHLIAWSAANILRVVMDEQVPPHFTQRRDEIRMRYHKSLAMGKPIQTGQPGSVGGYSWDIGTQGGGIGP